MILRPSAAVKALLAALVLAGCDPVVTAPAVSVAPPPAPQRPPARPAAPVASPESEAMRAYLQTVQAQLLDQGLLRTDGGGRDTPFTDRMLAENFIRIALHDEYQRTGQGFVQRQAASRLRRWESPVRIALQFGASVPQDRRSADRARVGAYLARLSQITGHPIGLSDAGANFFVHIVNEDERRALGPVITRQLPGLDAVDSAGITGMSRSTYCLVYALSEGSSSTYTRAFAVVRAEHPDLLRLSCLHEEIAQGLGLANDSALARPSIFNDDEEFALLTRMDEHMLRMLYHPRLRPGMTPDEARPIVFSLASALLGGES